MVSTNCTRTTMYNDSHRWRECGLSFTTGMTIITHFRNFIHNYYRITQLHTNLPYTYIEEVEFVRYRVFALKGFKRPCGDLISANVSHFSHMVYPFL